MVGWWVNSQEEGEREDKGHAMCRAWRGLSRHKPPTVTCDSWNLAAAGERKVQWTPDVQTGDDGLALAFAPLPQFVSLLVLVLPSFFFASSSSFLHSGAGQPPRTHRPRQGTAPQDRAKETRFFFFSLLSFAFINPTIHPSIIYFFVANHARLLTLHHPAC